MKTNTDKRKQIPAEDAAMFCRELAMVLRAGIPLRDGIASLSESREQGGEVFENVLASYERSRSLSASLSEAGCFPEYMIKMISLGESSGSLEAVARELATYYNREAELRASLKSAVLYPAVLTGLMGIIVAVLVLNVLPVFQRVLEDLGGYDTAGGSFSVGAGLGTALLIAVGVLIAVAITFFILLRTRLRGDTLALIYRYVPIARRISADISASRFASVCSIALRAGGDLPAAIAMAGELAADRASRASIERCGELISSGESFAKSVESSGLFSPMERKLLSVAAAAGELDGALGQLEESSDKRAAEGIASIIDMIEPTMVAVLSLVIGGILLTVMLPLLGILSAA